MNKKKYIFPVQLKQNNAKIIEGIAQNDTGILFHMKVMDGNTSFDFTGYTYVILYVKKPDGTVLVDSNQGALVDIIDAKNGEIAFNLPASCTAQNGMHFCEIAFSVDNTNFFKTSRFNYFVGQDPNAESEVPAGSVSQWNVLQQMIGQVAGIEAAETTRVNSETARVAAEATRASETSGIIAQATLLKNAAQQYAQAAQDFYNLITAEITEETEIDVTALATKLYVDGIANGYNAGGFTGTGIRRAQIRHGNYVDLPTLYAGEMGYCVNTNQLFIGDGTTNHLMNEPAYIAQSTAPTDTTKLWIDTSAAGGNCIKFHNGTAWTAANVAVFG